MNQLNKVIKTVVEFIKKVWPSVKLVIKTVAPII